MLALYQPVPELQDTDHRYLDPVAGRLNPHERTLVRCSERSPVYSHILAERLTLDRHFAVWEGLPAGLVVDAHALLAVDAEVQAHVLVIAVVAVAGKGSF